MVGNLLALEDVQKAANGMWAVIHVASPPPTSNNPTLFWNVNVNGSKNVIEACR